MVMMSMKSKFIKFFISILVFFSLFYSTFYVPMAFTTYNSSWYKIMCNYHNRCDKYGLQESYLKIDELTGYFVHKTDTLGDWTKKEKFHLKEVRSILDRLFVLFIISLLVLIFNLKQLHILRKLSKINLILILGFFIILPFFSTFWREIFHPLFFDNDLWKNTRLDVSYYIMPRTFFKITVGFIFTIWLMLNVVIYLQIKRIKSIKT